MPLYSYVCPAGHVTEQMGKMDGSDAPEFCPVKTGETTDVGSLGDGPCIIKLVCGEPLTKQITATRGLFPGSDNWRR